MGVSDDGGDSLTRTILQIDEPPADASFARAVQALRRVPGVLLADLNPNESRLIVAHDGAVSPIALVMAASAAGVRATLVGGAASAPAPPKRVPVRWLLVAMAIISVALVIIDLVLPDGPHKRLLLDSLVIGVWICFFGGLFVRERGKVG